MKTLVAEDDFTSRLLLQRILAPFGEVHIAVDGREALSAIDIALKEGEPYDLICLDIMMPEMDGHGVLKELRTLEAKHGMPPTTGSRVIMTTALSDAKNVMQAFNEQCEAYLTKPIDKGKLLKQLKELGLQPSG